MPSHESCIIALAIASESGTGSKTFEVAVSYEEALNRLVPISGPSSSLEVREVTTWPLIAGGRLHVMPQSVAWLEEVID